MALDAVPTTRTPEGPLTAPQRPLGGPLDDYSPAGALGVLASKAVTGAVQFSGAHPCTVFLERGRLYFVEGNDTGDALAVALVRGGRLAPDQWDEASIAGFEHQEVGDRLIESGAVSRDLLASVALSVSYDPLIDLLRFGAERLDVTEGVRHWLGPFRTFDVDAVMAEVRRRVREVDEMASTFPVLDVVVSPHRTLPEGRPSVTLRRDEWELVSMLGRGRHLVDLAEELGRGRWSTARIAHRLVTLHLLDVTRPDGEGHEAPAPVEADWQVDADWQSGDTAPAQDPMASVHPEVARALAESTYADSQVALNAMVEHLAAAPPEVEDNTPDASAPSPPPPPPPVLVDGTAGATPLPRREAAKEHMAQGPTGPADPEWLQSLYTSFEPETAANGRNGKNGKNGKSDANPVEAAFAVADDGERSGTLRRVVDAIKRL